MKQQFLINTVETFQSYVYEHNIKIVPSSASITIYRPASSNVLVGAGVMTVGSDGLLSYALTADDNAVADENYKAVVSYVHGSSTYVATLFYDVVRSKLVKVVTDDDLISELPQLRDNHWRVHGSAESGSTTSIVDSELKSFEDDYFTGGLATSLDRDETRSITGFVSSTGAVTTAAFSGAIVTDKYVLTRSYSKEIQRAFEKIEEMLAREGKRAHLILDPYDLREVHIYYSVAEVCKGLSIGEEGLFWRMWKEYETRGREAMRMLNLKYDSSADGYISGIEEGVRLGNARAGRR